MVAADLGVRDAGRLNWLQVAEDFEVFAWLVVAPRLLGKERRPIQPETH